MPTNGESSSSPQPSFARRAKLLVYACGIYSAYLTQGYVQEALATTVYPGPAGPERFPHLEALNAFQCLACFLVGGLLLLLLHRGPKEEGSKDHGNSSVASPLEYWRPALTNSVGPACGIIALKSISYPAQVSCSHLSAKACDMAMQAMGKLPSSMQGGFSV